MNSWRPDRESHIPLYLQIEQHIKEKILHGEWTIGTKIPSQESSPRSFRSTEAQ